MTRNLLIDASSFARGRSHDPGRLFRWPHIDLRRLDCALTRALPWALCLAVATGAQFIDAAHAQQDRTTMIRSVLVADVAALSSLLEGRFDNELQSFFDRDLMTPPAARTVRHHVVIRRSSSGDRDAPRFYLETSDASGAIVDQRILMLAPDTAANAITMTATPVRTSMSEGGLWRSAVRVDALTAAAAATSSSCVIRWRREGSHFKGRSEGAHCAGFLAPQGDRAAPRDLVIGPDALLATAATPSRENVQSTLRRVRPFSCWTAVLRGARHGDDGAGREDWLFRRDVLLHDQGEEARIVTDETPSREIRLRLRRVVWPYGANRPSLTLYVHEGAKERATSYAWGEFDAERLGLNLRWLQVSCSHAPERLFDAPGESGR